MVGFVTSSETEYYLDQVNKLFYGGKYKNWTPYCDLSIICGCNGYIRLLNGDVLKTSIITRYI